MEDGQIVDLYLSRDESAIEQTAAKYGLKLRHLAERILADPPSAEECENDTYLEAWQRIPPNEPRTYLFAFLSRITRHLAIDLCRYRSSQKRSAIVTELTTEMEEVLSSGSRTEDSVEIKELSRSINQLLSRCTEEQQVLFVRRYFYLDSIAEISSRLHLSESKVKTTLFRLRSKLKSFLEKEGYVL